VNTTSTGDGQKLVWGRVGMDVKGGVAELTNILIRHSNGKITVS